MIWICLQAKGNADREEKYVRGRQNDRSRIFRKSTRDMYLEYFPDFLKSIFEVLPQIDEESRNTIWDAIGATVST